MAPGTTVESDVAKRNDVTVKVDAAVVHKAKIVAAYENKTLAEFLSDTLAPIVEQLHTKHAQQVVAQSPPKGKGGKH